jgi:hypothetical protein
MPQSPFGPPLSLALDVYAWNAVIDRPYHPRSIEFPDAQLRFLSAGTRDSFEPWREASHGFLTYIRPLCGVCWVVFRLTFDPDSFLEGGPANTVAVVIYPGQVL